MLIGKQSLQQGVASVACGLMVTHRACSPATATGKQIQNYDDPPGCRFPLAADNERW
ncbi:hypothetical protein KWH04_08865 [Xanthomonas campestris pv. trichodesmae]|uniref:hypothetical protein n=1 Tax=Xanthomonas TaxID=338 RepID=UPI0002D78A5D|nr:hypothetical protein [Xanthomonas citri]MBV6780757.1 hypothetical protein [Xanthomonas campestris pv. trichodesmae]QTH26054.1 hypothetical protein XcfCFBP7767P_24150 [Xanthomonas citri pv. phaseoli var. fuscans]QTJ31023.1 hypothetical protein XcfCFBP6167P_24365 [Xanthomonas citri pv. phaseoli var. fuscans]QTJ31217.1 hypothetical protein XcfCFBP6975P_23735 [Xanthomonas citri pv. phaseoli var. fuscans]QTJ32020.1 hypothetical protein XcfCFBP6165P_22760 [Xanthomonas citri pv. phaseoli var. fusc